MYFYMDVAGTGYFIIAQFCTELWPDQSNALLQLQCVWAANFVGISFMFSLTDIYQTVLSTIQKISMFPDFLLILDWDSLTMIN